MKSFLKTLLATFIGSIIAFMLLFFIGMGILMGIASMSDKPVVVSPKSVLHIKLNQLIADRSTKNPFEGMTFPDFQPAEKLGLDDILQSIEKAKTDENIKGIFLDLTVIPAGIATIEEIRNALLDFKESGKFIVGYADAFLQSTYYLASVSDSVFLNPAGGMAWVGMRSEVMFYKNMLEKIGVEPQIIRHGKFKAAVEPFMLDKMSDENREQLTVFISSVWNHVLEGISKEREISVATLNEYANDLKIRLASDAVHLKMVDGLLYKDQVFELLEGLSGKEVKGKPNLISLNKYIRVPKKHEGKGLAKNKIAVIYANGEVIMGDGQEGNIGSDRISKAIRDARKDSTIKAIVLRVNSPGGSALASEVIWREMKLAAGTKPLIASMGDVAASGGYYIACPADTIVASPNTITGSIGVFGLLINARELMNKKIGITTDVAKTNKYSDVGSIFRPLSPEEREYIQAGVEDIYTTFVQHVAEGRGLSPEKVDSIGQGRIWTGVNAVGIGLVDVLGGLDKAVEIAASAANLTDYRIVSLPRLEDPFEQFVKTLSGDKESKILEKYFGAEFQQLYSLKSLLQNQGIMARMPYQLTVY